jgi:hypothetical protein
MVKSTMGSSSTTRTPYFSWLSKGVAARMLPEERPDITGMLLEEMPAAARTVPEERPADRVLPDEISAAFELPDGAFGRLKLPLDI